METYPDVDIDSKPEETSMLTANSQPSLTPAPTSSSQAKGTSANSQQTMINQAMILMMGHLAFLVDMRATRLGRSISWMIESVIRAALNPFQTSIDNLTTIQGLSKVYLVNFITGRCR